MLRFFVLFVVLLVALAWITRVREEFLGGMECFVDGAGVSMSPEAADALQQILKGDTAGMPTDPQALLKRVRGMLDNLEQPERWSHAIDLSDKDPGQLARMHLGIQNDGP
jgi:hypothetical protein